MPKRKMVPLSMIASPPESNPYAAPTTLSEIVRRGNPNMKPVPDVLYRGTESGNDKQSRLRVSPDGEMGPGIYATGQKWLAESYGGGPNASVKKGTRKVHELPIGPLKEHVGYVYGGTGPNDPGHLLDHRGDIVHWYDAVSNSAIAKESRRELAKVAKERGMKILVGDDESQAGNQISILDPNIVKHK